MARSSVDQEESQALYDNGARAAAEFIKKWDFAAWKRKCRQGKAKSIL
jgi:hypothetical protein